MANIFDMKNTQSSLGACNLIAWLDYVITFCLTTFVNSLKTHNEWMHIILYVDFTEMHSGCNGRMDFKNF